MIAYKEQVEVSTQRQYHNTYSIHMQHTHRKVATMYKDHLLDWEEAVSLCCSTMGPDNHMQKWAISLTMRCKN